MSYDFGKIEAFIDDYKRFKKLEKDLKEMVNIVNSDCFSFLNARITLDPKNDKDDVLAISDDSQMKKISAEIGLNRFNGLIQEYLEDTQIKIKEMEDIFRKWEKC